MNMHLHGKNEPQKLLVLPKDVPCGENNAFATSLAAWHRMIFNKANYVCEKCGKEIQLKWKLSGEKKIVRNNAHHIISQNLCDSFQKSELKHLLACGIALCDSCHYNEHLRLGGYEFDGALKAFEKFRGMEYFMKIKNPIYFGIDMAEDMDLRKRYDVFLKLGLNYAPDFKTIVDESAHEYKALILLSWIFYRNVYRELELLGWENMCEWTRHELQNAVDKANTRWWNEDIEYLAEEYNRVK
jgi:hypothetical protein